MAGQVLITSTGALVLGAGHGPAVGPAAPLTLPGTIANLAIGVVTSSSVALTWTAPTTGTQPFTGYSVIYSTSPSGPWTTFGTVSTTSVTVTGLASSTAYYFSVAAINGVGTGQYVTSQAITTLAVVAGATITTLQVRNGAPSAVTAPIVQAGHAFAPGDIPAGSYPAIRPTGTGSSVANYQWDQISTRKDGSWYYAVASFRADGAFAAYQTSGDTRAYDLVVTAGTPPYTTSSITPTTIAAASQLYVKLYGGDFTTEIGSGTYYYADFNYILANYPRDTWGLNPTGGWELIASGSVCNRYWAWMCARRKSDDAINKWLVVAMEVTVYASGEFIINPVVLQPWIYGAHPSGTLGPAATAQPNVSFPAQPRYAGFYEIWDGKTNTLIGARGGPNEVNRVLTIPAANFDNTSAREPVLRFTTAMSTYGAGSSQRGGAMPQSTGWMFQAASGGTLPSGIDPNWIYWAGYPVGSPLRSYLALERSWTTGFSDPISLSDPAWIAGHAYNAGDSVSKGGVGYVYITGGTSGSTGPVPNAIGSQTGNQYRSDNTATYVQASANWGSAGSGNVTAIPVCATFGCTAIDFKDENGQPYWFDPVNHKAAPWMLPMPDFEYTTGRSKIVHPFKYFTPAAPGMGEKYIPNEILVDMGGSAWNIMQQPGDDYLDNRLSAWNQRQALRLYQPGDRNTAQDARVMAARFFNYPTWGWDHRTGRLPLINLGHDRAGGGYTGYPSGTINSNLTWYVYSGDCVGSPTPMGVGSNSTQSSQYWRHHHAFSNVYGQVVNGSHCPNLNLGDRVINGDYVALQAMQAIHFGTMAYMFGSARNSPAGFPGLGGLTNHDFGQARAAGWDTVKQGTTFVFTPDWHLIKPYYRDNITDMSAYFTGLKPYVDANYSPKMAQWGLISPTTASIGGINNLWNLGHMMEGITYCAMALTPDYPGFKQAVDNYVMNYARVFDPNNGGCLYYVGTAFLVYGVTGAASSIDDTFAQMAMNVNNCGNPAAGQQNSFGQVPGTSFVCPGVGQSAPGNTFAVVGRGVQVAPGINILDGEQVDEDHNFCTGFVNKDATNVAVQIMAPIAVAASMPGADPRLATLWNAYWARIHTGGMIGPTFGNSFMYNYEPKS